MYYYYRIEYMRAPATVSVAVVIYLSVHLYLCLCHTYIEHERIIAFAFLLQFGKCRRATARGGVLSAINQIVHCKARLCRMPRFSNQTRDFGIAIFSHVLCHRCCSTAHGSLQAALAAQPPPRRCADHRVQRRRLRVRRRHCSSS